MSLKQILAAHREQILTACRAELALPDGESRVEHCLTEFVGDLQQALGAEASASSQAQPASNSPRVVGSSSVMTRVRSAIDQLSRRSRAPVFILGDAGTGRRDAARVLHHATYPEGHFLDLSSELQLAELAARVVGLRVSSSPQAAAGLTVYVHELPDTPPAVQVQLSALVSEQSLPLRVIVSSSMPLTQATRAGKLRSDLVFRFPSEVKLPSLSERKGDIPELVQAMAAAAAAHAGSRPTVFTPNALRRMQDHTWPGNLAELAGYVERVCQQQGPRPVEAEDLPDFGERPSGVEFKLPPTGIDFAEFERQLLTQALAIADNNQTRAASLLGLTRDQIRYRLAKFELLASTARSG